MAVAGAMTVGLSTSICRMLPEASAGDVATQPYKAARHHREEADSRQAQQQDHEEPASARADLKCKSLSRKSHASTLRRNPAGALCRRAPAG